MSIRFSLLNLLFLAATLSACAADKTIDTSGADTQRLEENSPESLVESRSCFTGSFESYESWLTQLAESNADFNRNRFERRISKEQFDNARSNLICRRILYDVDGVTVVGYLVYPAAQNGPLPVVIYNRGGSGSHARINRTSIFNHIFPLAESGYFVIASQYRGSGFSRDGLDAGEDEFGGKDVNDVLALFDLIDQLPAADSSRIGMFGWSRGAIMSFLAAARTDRLSAIVVGGAPTDIPRELEVRPEMARVFEARIPGFADNRIEKLKERSVLYWAEKLPVSTPILILHGQSDSKVTVNSALDLAAELQLRGIPYRLVVYENGTHSLLEYKRQVNAEVLNWFSEKLN